MAAAGPESAATSATLEECLKTKRYRELAAICDLLELQGAAAGELWPADWPYAVHVLAHLYNNDLASARFLWKRIPEKVKDENAEVAAAWRIGQAMWLRDWPGTYQALKGFSWSPQTQPLVEAVAEDFSNRMFYLLCKAYAIISTEDAARALGLSKQDTIALTTSRGWLHDASADMLAVTPPITIVEQKTDLGRMQNLTEYVIHLEQ